MWLDRGNVFFMAGKKRCSEFFVRKNIFRLPGASSSTAPERKSSKINGNQRKSLILVIFVVFEQLEEAPGRRKIIFGGKVGGHGERRFARIIGEK